MFREAEELPDRRSVGGGGSKDGGGSEGGGGSKDGRTEFTGGSAELGADAADAGCTSEASFAGAGSCGAITGKSARRVVGEGNIGVAGAVNVEGAGGAG
jgi:hypothetical protein